MTGHDRVVVVPTSPGPFREVPGDRSPDDVDELLDDLLGPADDGGPGIADAVLATGGGGAVVVGLVIPSPVLLGVGVVAVLLGSILPARSLWRRVRQHRLSARQAEVLGGGTPLRASPGPVSELIAAHDALFALAEAHPAIVGADERAAAHAAAADVASVLGGGSPSSADEVAFVADRASALAALVAAVEAEVARTDSSADTRPPPSEAEARQARLAARHEVDRAAGASSADDLRRLAEHHRLGGDG